MTTLLLQGPLLLWLLYCVARVATAPRNAVQVGAEVPVHCPAVFAYQTYLDVRHFYRDLSPGHLHYAMTTPSLTPQTVINIRETAGFQTVEHHYRVTELVPGQRMRLLSETSRVSVLGLFRGRSRSEVEFRFREVGQADARLGLTICIVFPNLFRHLLARLVFTEAIWQRHAREEMAALANLIERRYASLAA